MKLLNLAKFTALGLVLVGGLNVRAESPSIEIVSLGLKAPSFNENSLESNFAIDKLDLSPLQTERKVLHYSGFFGNVFVNTQSRMSWMIRNKGTEPIQWSHFSISGAAFSGQTQCPNIILPQIQCEISALFSPIFSGYHWGQMVMSFTDGDHLIFDLSGYGQ